MSPRRAAGATLDRAPRTVADADGIGAGNARTAGVVDTLIADRGVIVHLPVDALSAHPDNPRVDVGDVTELAASIRAAGVLEPVLVTTAGAFNAAEPDVQLGIDDAERWVIVAGHRRVAAAREAGLSTVPCLVRDDLVGATAREAMLIENLHRADLSPLEEARAFHGLQLMGLSQRTIAERVGCTQPHISKRVTLVTKLDERIRPHVESGRMSIESALDLAKLPAAVQETVVDELADGDFDQRDVDYAVGRAVRRTAELVERGQVIEALREAGVRFEVHDEPVEHDLEVGPYPLRYLVHVDAGEHTGLDCHLVIVGSAPQWDGSERRWDVAHCSSPGNHRSPDSGGLAANGSTVEAFRAAVTGDPPAGQSEEARAAWERQQKERDKQARAEEKRQRQLAERAAAREAFCRGLLAGKLPKGAADHVLRGGVLDCALAIELDQDVPKLAMRMLGAEPGERDTEWVPGGTAAYAAAAAAGTDLLRWALAARLGQDEQRTSRLLQSQRRPSPFGSDWDTAYVVRHLAFLTSCGYEPTKVEALPPDNLEDSLIEFDVLAPAGVAGGDDEDES